MADTVIILAASVTGISLYSIDHPILYPFHNAHMVRHIVLRPR